MTTIGSYAFQNSGLTSIYIPSTVHTFQDEQTFQAANNLESINVDPDNPNYSSSDGVLFNKGQTTLISFPCGKGGNYIIPNTVTSIFSWAFADASLLTSITIPMSLTNIGSYAFYNQTSLTSLIFPGTSSLTTIEEYAFLSAKGLTSITIPDSVTSIGDSAFLYSSLEKVYMSVNNQLNIYQSAFNKLQNFYGKENVLILEIFRSFSLSSLSSIDGSLYIGTLSSKTITQIDYRIISQPMNILYISENSLIAKHPFNYNVIPNYCITIEGNSNGITILKQFNIKIIDNQQTTRDIVISNNKIPEDSPKDTIIGKLNLTTEDDFVRYELVDDEGSNDNSNFIIKNNNNVYTNILFNINNKSKYSIRVKSFGTNIESIIILFVVKPIALDIELNTLVNTNKIITLQGISVLGRTLPFSIITPPKYGSLEKVSHGVYNYISNTNKQDFFQFNIVERLMTSNLATVVINNFSQSDIDNIPRIQGTFRFNSIDYDGTTWKFGTMRSEIFIQNEDFNQFGNYQLKN